MNRTDTDPHAPTVCFTYGSLMCEDIMAAVCGARADHRLAPADWDFAHFLPEGKARFMSDYVGFDTLQAR